MTLTIKHSEEKEVLPIIEKKKYLSPKITMIIVEQEECIATGSALVMTTDSNGLVHEEWEDEKVYNHHTYW